MLSAPFMAFCQDDDLSAIRKSIDSIIKADSTLMALFPSSFNEYQSLFGYDGPFCQYFSIVDHLRHSETVNQDELQRKVLSCCINGVWEADHVTYLSVNAIDYLLKERTNKDRVQKSIILLNSYTRSQNVSFWHFIFDGPHPENYYEVKQKIYSEWLSYGNYKYMDSIETGYISAVKCSEQYY